MFIKSNFNSEKEQGSCGCSEECSCGEDCSCEEEKCSEQCTCGEHKSEHECKHEKHEHECKHENGEHKGESCGCSEECTCGEECKCTKDEKCSEDCSCGEHACECDENSACQQEKNDYLNLAKVIQADFDNYRKRAAKDLDEARFTAQRTVIEAFLPCLDTFREAKKNITDEKVLEGVNMIENKIVSTLEELGVEKVPSVGQKYDPYLHNVIATMCDNEQENDVILQEYQTGYKFGGKIIRYAKVIVNKKEEN